MPRQLANAHAFPWLGQEVGAERIPAGWAERSVATPEVLNSHHLLWELAVGVRLGRAVGGARKGEPIQNLSQPQDGRLAPPASGTRTNRLASSSLGSHHPQSEGCKPAQRAPGVQSGGNLPSASDSCRHPADTHRWTAVVTWPL